MHASQRSSHTSSCKYFSSLLIVTFFARTTLNHVHGNLKRITRMLHIHCNLLILILILILSGVNGSRGKNMHVKLPYSYFEVSVSDFLKNFKQSYTITWCECLENRMGTSEIETEKCMPQCRRLITFQWTWNCTC